MITKIKENCIITISDRTELGLNSSPFLRAGKSGQSSPCEAVATLMRAHGMSREDAEKTHEDNLKWAM